MKTFVFSLLSLFALTTQAQTKILAVSPIPPTIDKVNGLALGIGHYLERDTIQTINGVNLDISPFSMLIFMNRNPSDLSTETVTLHSNGLNIGISGYDGGVIHKGISLSAFNITNEMHGVSAHALYNSSTVLNGLHVSSIGNFADNASGIHIAGFVNKINTSTGVNVALHNRVRTMKGLQIGMVNSAVQMKGLQIGLFNQTDALKGLQIGLINVNGKRTLPFLNF